LLAVGFYCYAVAAHQGVGSSNFVGANLWVRPTAQKDEIASPAARNDNAVGKLGTILHYNGSSWSAMTSGTDKSLMGIWVFGANDVFVVGDGGTILYY